MINIIQIGNKVDPIKNDKYHSDRKFGGPQNISNQECDKYHSDRKLGGPQHNSNRECDGLQNGLKRKCMKFVGPHDY